ncbi:site-specific integrase, partial [Desulfovibrio sp. OttesenSCG-928-G15]|nr:site-specific integrase [Desulfovibrio sp. OttesenSCG-928-G15]
LAARTPSSHPVKDGYTRGNDEQEKSVMPHSETTDIGVYTKLSGRTLDSLSDNDIRAIAAEWLLGALKGYESLKTEAARARANNPAHQARSPEQVHIENKERSESEVRIRRKHAAIHKAALGQREFSHIQPHTDLLLDRCGIQSTGQDSSPQYDKVCEEMTKAKLTFYRMQDDYAEGNFTAYEEELRRIEANSQASPPAPQPATATTATTHGSTAKVNGNSDESSVPLQEAIEAFFKEKELDGSWRPKVAGMERKKFELFTAVVDPSNTLTVDAIRAKHLVRYKEILHLMPANKGKKKEYRDLPLKDLLALVEAGSVPKEMRMEPNTIRTYCQSLTTFINWAARMEYHTNSAIAKNLQIKAEKQAHEYRDPFTTEDIQKLFSPEELTKQSKPSFFWIPLLGLFTGARLEELAQLHTDDIVFVNQQEDARPVFTAATGEGLGTGQLGQLEPVEGETLCLFINKGKPYQRLKTSGSRRYVPLSPVLAYELGFLDYVASVFTHCSSNGIGADESTSQSRGEGRLFPELTRKKETDNFAHSVSKWFNTHRKRVGVIAQPGAGKKDFHSFRHTVARWCEQNGVPEKSAARYIGHTHDTMTFGRYGADTAAQMLYQGITDGMGQHFGSILDIDGLKQSPWVKQASTAK